MGATPASVSRAIHSEPDRSASDDQRNLAVPGTGDAHVLEPDRQRLGEGGVIGLHVVGDRAQHVFAEDHVLCEAAGERVVVAEHGEARR